MRFLRATRQMWPVISLRGLPADSPTLNRKGHGSFFTLVRESGSENVILLPSSVADYSDRLEGKFLRELRRRRRKLEELGNVRILLRDSSRSTRENLDRFVEVEDSGWKGDGRSSIRKIPGEKEFYLEAALGLAEQKLLEWNFLELDGRAIAGQLALRNGRTLYILKIGFQSEFARFAPGNLLLLETITSSIASGAVDRINFLAVCDWHADWNISPCPLYDATVFPFPRIIGRCMEAARRLIHRHTFPSRNR